MSTETTPRYYAAYSFRLDNGEVRTIGRSGLFLPTLSGPYTPQLEAEVRACTDGNSFLIGFPPDPPARLADWFTPLPDEAVLDYTRAGGQCLCTACGRPYWRHPHDYRTAAPFLRVLCDGRRVKL